MAEDASVQVIQRAYEAFQRGDIPTVLQMVTDDVQWQLHGPPDIPFAGKLAGRDQVADFFRKLAETEDTLEFTPKTFFSDNDAVIVLGHYRAVIRATGRGTDFDWIQVFKVRDGRVAAWEEFLDTASVVDAYRTAVPAHT